MKKEASREDKKCTMKDCKRPYKAKGYCTVHYRKWRHGELEAKPRYRICGEENCRKAVFKGGMCEAHYTAWAASKKPQAPVAAPAAPETAAAPEAPIAEPAA